MKNEARYIREFIEYYSLHGCDIIIYDNGSTDGSDIIVKEYSNVIYYEWRGIKRQVDAYNHACKKYRYKYDYIMFYDSDEFLVCEDILRGKTLTQILDDFFVNGRVGCLCVNWLMFGSSGFVDFPDDGVINSFTKYSEYDFSPNAVVKSCVIPSKVVGWVNPHVPLLIMGYNRINIDGAKVFSPVSAVPNRKDIWLHQYFVKNRKYFERKINRGRADISEKRSMDEFEQNDRNDCINDNAVRIGEYLRGKVN